MNHQCVRNLRKFWHIFYYEPHMQLLMRQHVGEAYSLWLSRMVYCCVVLRRIVPLGRQRMFLSHSVRMICFAVRFGRSGSPQICNLWGERRHWALSTRPASSVRFNCRTRAQVVDIVVIKNNRPLWSIVFYLNWRRILSVSYQSRTIHALFTHNRRTIHA